MSEGYEVRALVRAGSDRSMLDGVEGIDALEVNLSCPNVQGGRIPFGTDTDPFHGNPYRIFNHLDIVLCIHR